MRYLVTGGAGFIGSHLAEHLVQKGEDVVVLDNFATGKRENLEAFRDKITLIEGSVLDHDTCVKATRGVDFVFHEAAVPSVPKSVVDPMGSHAACATGTLNLLMAARDANVKRFVYAASSSAYGDTDELPKHEAMFPRTMSPYAVAKFTGEAYCRAFHSTYGLPTVSLRYFNVFGPRQDPTSQYAAAVAKFATCAIEGTAPTIYGDGEQTRDFTYIANVIEANLLACRAPDEANGDVFNVGCGERVSVNELWRRIAGIVGSDQRPSYEPSRASDVRDSLASLTKIQRVLGYSPVVDFDSGLRLTIDYLRGAK